MGFQIKYQNFLSIRLNHEYVHLQGQAPGICTELEIQLTEITEEMLANRKLRAISDEAGLNLYQKIDQNGRSLSNVDSNTFLYFHLIQRNPNFSAYTEPYFTRDEQRNKLLFFTNFNRNRLTTAVSDEAVATTDSITWVESRMELDLPPGSRKIDFLGREGFPSDQLLLEDAKIGPTSIHMNSIKPGLYTGLRIYDVDRNLLLEQPGLFYKTPSRSSSNIAGIVELHLLDLSTQNYSIIFKRKATKWLYLLGHDNGFNIALEWGPNVGDESDVYQSNINFNSIPIPSDGGNAIIQRYKEIVQNAPAPFDNYILSALASDNPIPASDLPKTGISAKLNKPGQINTIEIKNLSNPDNKSLTKVQNEDFLTHFMMIPNNLQN